MIERGAGARKAWGAFRAGSRRRRRIGSSLAERGAMFLLGLVIVVGPQLIGGVLPWAIVTIGGVSLCAWLLACVAGARNSARAPILPALFWVMGALLAWTSLQAVPLPCGLVGWLSPASASTAEQVERLLGSASPARCTLSLAAGATRQEVVKGIAIIAVFASGWLLSASGRRNALIALVASSTLLMSLVALGHMVLEQDKVFGLYQPLQVRRNLLLAPLLNSNNLGGFVVLGIPIWIVMAQRVPPGPLRFLCWAAIALGLTTVALTLSRGAISVLFGALAFQGVRHALARRRRSGRWSGWQAAAPTMAAVLAVAAGSAASLALIGDRVVGEFQQGDLSKLDLIASVFAFALEHPLVGVGRGAFSSAFTATLDRNTRFGHAENLITQWFAEWGIPASLFLLGSLAVALSTALRRTKSARREAAAIGLLALVLQNMFDLGLEILGVAIVAAAALAIVVAPSRPLSEAKRSTELTEPGTGPRLARRWLPWAALLATGLAYVLLAPRLASQDSLALEQALQSARAAADRGRFRAVLKSAMRLHPAEPVFPILAAAEGLDHGDPATARFINRAMVLAPGWAGPHAQAFLWLWKQGRQHQALLELRKAAELDTRSVTAHLCVLARADFRLVLEAIPPRGAARPQSLAAAAECNPVDHPTTERLDTLLAEEFGLPEAFERRAERLVRRGDFSSALTELDRILERYPGRSRALVARARTLLAANRASEALAAADRALPRVAVADLTQLHTIRARAAGQLGDEPTLQGALDALRIFAESDKDRLARTYALAADIRARRGDFGQAYQAYREAYDINGDTIYLRYLADLARSLKRPGQALWAYMRLCELEPTQGDPCAKRDELRKQSLGLNPSE